MSRLSRLFDKSKQTLPVTSASPDGPAWTEVGNAADHLPAELESLYWTGVNKELDCIVSTLRRWQQPHFQHIQPDADNTLVNGFDTFVADVVPQSAQTPPQLPSQVSTELNVKGRLVRSAQVRAMELAAAKTRTKVNVDVHKRLLQRPVETDAAKRRARLLLQAAGFLDIEKTIEHSPAANTPSPLTPQLRMTKKGFKGCPAISTLPCSRCKRVIRGSMYQATGGSTQTICEDCYWEHHYGDPAYIKQYKHSIASQVDELMSKHTSCRSCRKNSDKIRRPSGLPGKTGVHKLADAKYLGVQEAQNKSGLSGRPTPLAKVIHNDYNSRSGTSFAASRSDKLHLVGEEWLYKDFVQENPWKNIRVAVRVGPLVFENGSKESRNGAGISIRDPIFGQGHQRVNGTCLAVCGENERQLWRYVRPLPWKRKRFQAVLKQVVGTPFTGWPLSPAEDEIITLLVKASNDDIEGACQELHDKVKAFLSPWVSVYFESIVGSLLDTKTRLAWDGLTNNCQQFCNSLIDWELFGPLVASSSVTISTNDPPQPLYRMSFVCRPRAAQDPFNHPNSITNVPYGLTEEYIRRFHFGCYTGPDVIDSLHEYWYDWAGFHKPLYPHQFLFPWDCTEALRRYPVKCGTCTLSKHVWAFPFDSWSIIALHLSRDKCAYPASELSPNSPSDASWITNRLTLLTALDTLSAGATAMSQSLPFQSATQWLHLQLDPSTDRIKLGGINRAQPYSHALERRTHDDFFVAKWVSDDRLPIQTYEDMREKRYSPRTAQERELVFWGAEGSDPPGEYATWAVEYTRIPNANFPVSVSFTTGCGACGTQATAAACGANCEGVPGKSWPAIVIGLFVAFGGVLFGYDTGTISGILAMPYWQELFSTGYRDPTGHPNITSSQSAAIVSILSAGTFFGALGAAPMGDRIGRRWGLIASAQVFNLGVILQTAATGIPLFLAGRFFAGLGVGLISALIPLYQSETAPKWIRGTIVGAYQLSITIGLLLASIVNNSTQNRMDTGCYRIPIAVQFAWSIILVGGMLILPDTPRYLIKRGNIDGAARALGRLRRLPADDPAVREELAEIQANHEYELSLGKSTYLDCFKGNLLKRLLTGCGLQALQQLTGINFIFYYGTQFFKNSGFKNSFTISLITNCVNVGSTLPGLYAIEKWGRRPVLFWGAVGMCVSQFVVAIIGTTTTGQDAHGVIIVHNEPAQKAAIAFICFYIFFFASTWGPSAWVVTGEIFPLKIRAKSLSMTTATNWLLNWAIAYSTPYLVDYGPGNANLQSKIFFVWGGCCFLCISFVYFLIYETKGLTLEQVDELYGEVSSARLSKHWTPTITFREMQQEKARDVHLETAEAAVPKTA
ncbi:hypothetical protein KXV81_006701 [Aspergillus fumigatus]|nr:hypothetical protein KXX45_001386 [Aspergillus fumigatus]KAH1337827.1 hypothetical protein KXX67_001126 [Aspergillus fumigatus]KAH1404682.1 hypothetical protein KXX51_000326 [Aspergillus fumigatus]KAH1570396.1 hypothetical protein KXX28_008037 [Aspergillus fumigatus]KAH1580340.1 hypothetical protein KXX69_003550 [Aspergillus fumigatus]